MEQQVVDMNLLAHYKDLYSGHKILYVRFLDNDFIFRSLTRKEYKYLLQSGLSQMDMEDSICNTACLYPEDYDFTVCGFAGLNEYVANIIKDISDFNDIRSILNEYHNASIPVYHFDLYRLENTGIKTITDELREYSTGRKITFVEWAEFSQGELPFERIEINVTYDNDDSRIYEFKAVGEKDKKVIEGLKN